MLQRQSMYKARLVHVVHTHWGITKESHPPGTARRVWLKRLTRAVVLRRLQVRGRVLNYDEQPTAFVVGRAISDADRLLRAFGDKLVESAAHGTSVRFIGLQRVTPDDVLLKYGEETGPLIWLTLPKEPADIWVNVTVKTLVSWYTPGPVLPPGPEYLATSMLPYNQKRIEQLRHALHLVILQYSGPFLWIVQGYVGGPSSFNYTDDGFWRIFRQSMKNVNIYIHARRKVLFGPRHGDYQWYGRFAVLMSENDVDRLEALIVAAAQDTNHLLHGLQVQRADTTHYPKFIRLSQLPSANKGPTPIEAQLQHQFGMGHAEARNAIMYLKQTRSVAAAEDATACRRLV